MLLTDIRLELIRDSQLFKITETGELQVYACRIGGTFFDELCLIMIGFDRGQRVGLITVELWDVDIGWKKVW